MSDTIQENSIVVKNLDKTFRLPHEKRTSIKSVVLNLFRRQNFENQRVLKDISFEIKQGEFFGIVGRNGSGKSTLLKLLAGIYTPTNGSVEVTGRLTPFIELGVGFNPNLTGRENVFLNGALLGFNRKEMNAMYKDIVEFAELERFMDQKLKNYSSGMQVRLAFSIAIRAKSEILLIDEVLAVGDSAFQEKCYAYFEKIKQEGVTVVFVSHDMDSVKRFCDRALVIQKGEMKVLGTPQEAAEEYDIENEESSITHLSQENSRKKNKLKDLDIKLLNEKGSETSVFEYGDNIGINLSWKKELNPKNVGVALFHEGRVVFASNSTKQGMKTKNNSTTNKVVLNLGPGQYTVIAALFSDEDAKETIVYEPHGPQFIIKKGKQYTPDWSGVTKLESRW
jgi:ABC-type polysaccharide/polyol phosphate transport system ATPase subunit